MERSQQELSDSTKIALFRYTKQRETSSVLRCKNYHKTAISKSSTSQIALIPIVRVETKYTYNGSTYNETTQGYTWFTSQPRLHPQEH